MGDSGPVHMSLYAAVITRSLAVTIIKKVIIFSGQHGTMPSCHMYSSHVISKKHS